MHKLYELKDKLMQELEDYADNGKFSKDDVEAIKYTASAIDHICNIVEGEEEYSEAGNYPYGGRMMTGGSYARGGRMGGSYAGRRRDSMGRYSRGYSRAGEDIADQLRSIMADAHDERIKSEIERVANKVESM